VPQTPSSSGFLFAEMFFDLLVAFLVAVFFVDMVRASCVLESKLGGERLAVGLRRSGDALKCDPDFGRRIAERDRPSTTAVFDSHPCLDVAGIGGFHAAGAGHGLADQSVSRMLTGLSSDA
jgi:hypothetical protein